MGVKPSSSINIVRVNASQGVKIILHYSQPHPATRAYTPADPDVIRAVVRSPDGGEYTFGWQTDANAPITKESNGVYSFTFTPTTAGHHLVVVTTNEGGGPAEMLTIEVRSE